MDNPVVQQYAHTLKGLLRGRKQRKGVLNEFYSTAELFLGDNPDPDYNALVAALGSPEEFVSALQEKYPYRPMSLQAKLGVLLLAVCIVAAGFGLFHVITAESPETATLYTDPKEFSHESIPEPLSALVDDFNPRDTSWGQPEGYSAYILEAHNENTVPAQVLVRYREDIEPHVFMVPPGETYVLAVNDALPGEHVVSFDAENHTYAGYVEVYVSETALP